MIPEILLVVWAILMVSLAAGGTVKRGGKSVPFFPAVILGPAVCLFVGVMAIVMGTICAYPIIYFFIR